MKRKTEHPCKCGESRWFVLVCHHRNPDEKEATISSLLNRNHEHFMAELDKCDIMCENCHRALHFAERTGQFKNIPECRYNQTGGDNA